MGAPLRAVRQQLTAVARPWRGRGVGRALKAAMLHQVHEAHPEATVIGTNNAEVNAPILSINARVGFKAAWRNVDYQVTRDVLDEWENSGSLADRNYRDQVADEEDLPFGQRPSEISNSTRLYSLPVALEVSFFEAAYTT
jgi:GNAT superfamily N-acetyltransferase